jgi:hypothetical protein
MGISSFQIRFLSNSLAGAAPKVKLGVGPRNKLAEPALVPSENFYGAWYSLTDLKSIRVKMGDSEK